MKTILILIAMFVSAVSALADETSVGALYPLTGPAAEIGQQRVRGAKLAVQRLAEMKPPVALKLSIEDTVSDSRIAVSAVRRLIDLQKVKTVFSALSGVTFAVRPITEREGILLFANATHPDLLKDTKFSVRNYHTAVSSNNELMRYFKERNFSRLAVFAVEDDFGLAVAKDLEERANLPKNKFIREHFLKTETDFRAQMLRIRAMKPDILFVVALGPVLGQAVRRAKEFRLPGEVLLWAGCSQVELISGDRPLFDGILSIDAKMDRQSADYKDLLARYHKEYPGEYLPPSTVSEYDAYLLYAKAQQAAGDDAKAIRDYFIKEKKFQTSSGEIEFDETADALWPMAITRIGPEGCS